jgi:hypothetical protein
MKNLVPLLLVGGAAVMVMGGKKKTSSKPKIAPNYVFHASGHNIFARGLLQAALLNQGLNSTMYDQNDLAEAFDSAWAKADGLIVAIDTANEKLAGAWAAAADNSGNTSAEVAGTMAKPMTMEQLGTQGVAEAVALAKGAKVA